MRTAGVFAGDVSFSTKDSKNESSPYIKDVNLYIDFSKHFEFKNLDKNFFIKELYSTVVHELAHAYDENLIIDELAPTKRRYIDSDRGYESFNKLKQILLYNTDPSEIRSKLNECLLQVKSYKRYSAKKDIKKIYKDKNGDKNETKNYARYPIQKEKNLNDPSRIFNYLATTIYGFVYILEEFGENMVNFINLYRVAFVRDYSDVMKRRYYDPLFKDKVNESAIPPLRQMDEFLDVLLSTCDKLSFMNSDSVNYPAVNRLFDRPIFWSIFESYDAKKLQEAIDEVIKSFK